MIFQRSPLRLRLVLVLSVLGIAIDGAAQTISYETNAYVETIAGSGFIGHVDGQGVDTMFSHPMALTVDSQTNVYVWDAGNRAVRRIDASFKVTTILSNFYGGVLSLFATDNDLIILGHDALTQNDTRTLWWIASTGSTNDMKRITVANEPVGPSGVIQTANGVFFTSDNRIYILTNSVAAIFAGSGNNSSIDGQGIFSSFNQPLGLAADAVGNLYVGQPYAIRSGSLRTW